VRIESALLELAKMLVAGTKMHQLSYEMILSFGGEILAAKGSDE